MSIIRGYDGSCTVSGLNLGFVEKWEVQFEVTEVEKGPFINDSGRTYAIVTSRKLTGKVDAIVPKFRNAGQTAIINASANGGPFPIILATTDGYTVTVPSGIVTNYTLGQEAGDTVTFSFDFRDSLGTYTVT